MTRIVYVNGRYVSYGEAAVHVEDRGFQFADGVYEVCEVQGGHLVDEARHIARLWRSLSEIAIERPMSAAALGLIMRETIRRNRVMNGLVYLQVTRGTAPRDFLFPDPATTPATVVCLARRMDQTKLEGKAAKGMAVKTVPDIRWGRCDLKTVMLLPACLAKDQARKAGAAEAWFVDDKGFVTEGGSTNAWIIDKTGKLITRPLGNNLLAGVTRATAIEAIAKHRWAFEERAFTVKEALSSAEAFVSSATGTIMPVVSIDGQMIGDGKPGLKTLELRRVFHHVAKISNKLLQDQISV